ncbi:MAG: radical SAM family heme chaperone HemW [Mariprofundales bacterium]
MNKQVQAFAIYIHIPWCVSKCHYCDFNSHASEPDWQQYLRSLQAECEYWQQDPRVAGRRVSSIYFGGGTPSLAPAGLIASMIRLWQPYLLPDAEISLEANPGTLDAKRFVDYYKAGVNRLSIGIQSLDVDELIWLGRIHTADEARQTIITAQQVGFENISVDFMYGLPKQTLEQWRVALHSMCQLPVQHISCYQLTLEEGTTLTARNSRRPLALPDEDLAKQLFELTNEILSSYSYNRYEISNFFQHSGSEKSEFLDWRSHHNDNYWLYGDYIGLGAGAAGKLDLPDGGVWRYVNISAPQHYMQEYMQEKSGNKLLASEECLLPDHAAREAAWLGLRRSEGLDANRFITRFGTQQWQEVQYNLRHWQASGHVQIDTKKITLAPHAFVLADSISEMVL